VYDAIARKDGKPEGEGEPKLKDAAKGKPDLKLTVGRKDAKRGWSTSSGNWATARPSILAVPDPWLAAPPPPPPQMPGIAAAAAAAAGERLLSGILTGGYYAFRERTLPSFVSTNASKLTYLRGGQTYAAEKEEKKDDKAVPPPPGC